MLRLTVIACLAAVCIPSFAPADEAQLPGAVLAAPWSGERAMGDIARLLEFTPRSPGAPGHETAIEFIKQQLAATSAKSIRMQRWVFETEDGGRHQMTNIMATADPGARRRIIVGTHYDSIVRAYRDPNDPNGLMPGANNSGSGVAVLLETARAMSRLPSPPVAVDFVFFDGEEGPKALGAGDPQWRALGSPYFASQLRDLYPAGKPERAVIFDMVCSKTLTLNPEVTSLTYAREEVEKFWRIGAGIDPNAFPPEPTKFPISDDHTALAGAGIPSFLVIDFKYEPWFNTREDTLDKCSPRSLETVGRTLLRYIYSAQ